MADETTDAAKGSEDTKVTEAADLARRAIAAAEANRRTNADIDAVASGADNPDAVKNALKAERAKAKDRAQEADEARSKADELAAELKKYQDRDKSDQQKLEERATSAEREATDAKKRLLRFQVAAAKKLPMDLAERLQGDTKVQLENDADRLLELVKPDGKPSGDADAGKGEGGAGNTFNDLMRQKARS